MLEDTIREKADAWVRSLIKPRTDDYDLSPERVRAAMDVITAARAFFDRQHAAQYVQLQEALVAWDASGKEEA